jgi:two-component system, cell cycle sensor histidine kinase PleC
VSLTPTAEQVETKVAHVDHQKGRRVTLQHTVKDMRERLTSDSGLSRAFDSELIRLAARTRLAWTPWLIVFAFAITAALSIWVTPSYTVIWFAAVLLVSIAQYIAARRFVATEQDSEKDLGWKSQFVTFECLASIVWASVVAFTLLGEGEGLSTFVLFTIILKSAVIAVVSAPILSGVFAGLAPMTIAAIAFAKPGTDVYGFLLALMGACSVAFFLLLAKRLNETHAQTLIFRVEKDKLIHDLEQANAMARDAQRRAEEANVAKSRFLATMSHELRTPLNAILGFSEVLKGEMFGPHAVEQYRDYSNDIHTSGQHLLALINEILDLSRIEAGRYELHEEAVAIAGIVEDCCYLLAMRAKGKMQTIRQEVAPELAKVWVDERALRQVILNLLSNAVKFTPQNGEIIVRAGMTKNGGQYVSVIDNGPGIPESEIATAMASFGRGSTAIKTAEQGTGLGLPIVKGLVEMHGGRFLLSSRIRVGTEVTFTLPPTRVMQALGSLSNEEPTQTPRRAA